jgi:acrylyl-CoA reductase (NADPH)
VAAGGSVAACGHAGGAALASSALPFTLRGVALVDINSVPVPIGERRAIWNRLATDLRPNGLGEGLTEVDLDGLPTALDGVLAAAGSSEWAAARPRPVRLPVRGRRG